MSEETMVLRLNDYSARRLSGQNIYGLMCHVKDHLEEKKIVLVPKKGDFGILTHKDVEIAEIKLSGKMFIVNAIYCHYSDVAREWLDEIGKRLGEKFPEVDFWFYGVPFHCNVKTSD